MSTSVNFPYQFDGRGRTKDALAEYVRQLVEQVLFTSPGERVNLPDFGSGLLQLPFAPNSVGDGCGHAVHRAGCAAEVAQQLHQGAVGGRVVRGSRAHRDRVLLAVEHRRHPGADVRLRREPVIYQCCEENRKAAVLGNPTLNGIDYLEVLGFDAEPLGLQPQTILMVRCLKAAPAGLSRLTTSSSPAAKASPTSPQPSSRPRLHRRSSHGRRR